MSASGAARPLVAAVVPLYNPSVRIERGLRALAAQVDRLILVDDGSTLDCRTHLERLGLLNTELVRLERNSGIATAVNTGLLRALTGECHAVLLQDQDSVVAEGYVRAALDAAADRPASVITAGTVNGKRQAGRAVGQGVRQTLETIQSGMLIPVSVLQKVGLLDESLFIDCVDTEFILRCAGAGVPTLLVDACEMEHELGKRISVTLPRLFRRRQRSVSYHAPIRRYYITRNRALLLKRFWRWSPVWALAQCLGQMQLLLLDLAFGPARAAQCRAVLLGLWDALSGRTGPIPSAIAQKLAPAEA